jgi:2-polyprenyl-6-methoxyphenol hydroxylase-like FAD-dependent oxidoreductase
LGLKAHARGVTLAADLEMHVTSAGYVGLCRLADETVNVCGLFRCRTPQPDLAQRWREQLGGGPGTPLQARLRGAQWDEASFCSVSGLSLKPRTAAGRAECCVGDAVTMIAPVTGNGMSMAFESAELAVDPLVAFSEGRRPWAAARAAIATRCDRRFRVRLFTSAAMQRALVWRPEAGEWLVRALGWRMIWRAAFASTR